MSEEKGNMIQASPTCMESVNRMMKLPVVESTVLTATTIYEKVKDYNCITHLACTSAEMAVNKVVEVGKPIASPIVQSLEGPIRKVDGVLCSGLDYVENKVPAVKMSPCKIIYQMYSNTKDYVQKTVSPAVEKAYTLVEPAIKTTYEKIEPAVQTAKSTLEPTFEKAKSIVEPVVEKYFGCNHEHENMECENCQKRAENKTEHDHDQ